MSTPPASPCIYHITHVDNLPAMIQRSGLLSDAAMFRLGGPTTAIGMGTIKERRLSLPVACHPGLCVGECVPFYFCPRSIMLYVISRANHQSLSYEGGQGPIVHLEADLAATVRWANAEKKRWAFSLSNAGAGYAQFRKDLARLGDIDWDAVASTNFANGSNSTSGLPVKEGKQAEFLVEDTLPWSLVQRIGAHSTTIAGRARAAITFASHKPPVSVQPTWYF